MSAAGNERTISARLKLPVASSATSSAIEVVWESSEFGHGMLLAPQSALEARAARLLLLAAR